MKKKHKIGEHGTVVMLLRRGKKIISICAECGKEIKEPEPKAEGSHLI